MTADQPPQSPTAPVPADEFAARVEAALDELEKAHRAVLMGRTPDDVDDAHPRWMGARNALRALALSGPAAQPAGEGQAAASDEEFDAAMERLVGASIDFGACTQDDAEGQALETLHQCRAAMRALWHRRPPAGDADAVGVLMELHDEIARLLAWWSRPGETPPSDYDQYRHKVSVGLEHALLAAKRALAARGQEQEAQEAGGGGLRALLGDLRDVADELTRMAGKHPMGEEWRLGKMDGLAFAAQECRRLLAACPPPATASQEGRKP